MSTSVTAILYEKYGITARPGAKILCPFCEHKTFSIKKDDTIVKCFHPDCLKYVTDTQRGNNLNDRLTLVLEGIFGDFHRGVLNRGHGRQYYIVISKWDVIKPGKQKPLKISIDI